MEIKNVALMLVDISGYTQFMRMHQASVLHAEQIITELLDAVIDQAEYPLQLNKLEGDAALLYAELPPGEEAQAARDIVTQAQGFFTAFKERQQGLITAGEGGCPCDACRHIHDLQLKAMAHYGEVVIKQVRNFTELAGEPVILVHRLLKNSVAVHEYLLLTAAFDQLSGGLPHVSSEQRMETYDDMGEIPVAVYYPELLTLVVPQAAPETRPAGFFEGVRLGLKVLWARLFRPRRIFRNLPR